MKQDNANWADISAHWSEPPPSRMTFVDLFCGAGGLSKGFEWAGLHGACGLDWFKEAGETYSRNFGHPFVGGDITKPETKARLYETIERRIGRSCSPDIVAGGFPCQGFSMEGNRVVDDPRNSLYKELVEIVWTLRPKFVVCENVKGLRSMLRGGVEKKILEDFKDIGYDVSVATLCAADYGVPQLRERVVFIGNRLGLANLHPKPVLPPDGYVTVGAAIGDLVDRPADPSFNHEPAVHRPDMVERMAALKGGESVYPGFKSSWRRLRADRPAWTIKENHGQSAVHPTLPRVLTAREMARLQSFPDDFVFEGTKSKTQIQIGNAVPPLLGKAIGLAVRCLCGDLPRE